MSNQENSAVDNTHKPKHNESNAIIPEVNILFIYLHYVPTPAAFLFSYLSFKFDFHF